MTAQQSVIDDLLDFALRLPPRVGIALAAVSWMLFNVVAAQTVVVAGSDRVDGIATFTLHSVIHFSALFLEFAVPFCLLVGVTVSLIKRRRAARVLALSQENPTTAIASMNWQDFERLVGAAFRAEGFDVVELGGPRPDGGVDHVLTKDSKRYLVQCKHYWKEWVGVAVVRELYGVVTAKKADGGYVVTSGTFSEDAQAFAQSCKITLVDGIALKAMIDRSSEQSGAEGGQENHSEAIPACPECGSTMVGKVAGKGRYEGQPFWSCSTFPKCRGIVHIEQVA